MSARAERIRALYRDPFEGHECTLYCDQLAGIHADLVYSTERATPHTVNQAYTWTFWVRVVSVETATEAPPIAAIDRAYHDVITADPLRRTEDADQTRWIVRWEDDEQIWGER